MSEFCATDRKNRFDVVDTFPYLSYLLELHLSLLLPQDIFLPVRHGLLKLENSLKSSLNKCSIISLQVLHGSLNRELNGI